MNPLLKLADEWRSQAEMLLRYSDERGATACELHAKELEAVWNRWQSEELRIAEASAESGYTEDGLRRLVREEKIPNAGRPNSPRIRRADVPKKPGRSEAHGDAKGPSDGYNVDEDARSIAKQLGR